MALDSRDYVLSGIYYSVLVLVYAPSKHDVDQMLVQCWRTVCDAGPASNQHWFNASCLLGCVQHNTKHLYNICTMRRRRSAGVVQMLYKCFVFAWNSSWSGGDYKPTPTQCRLNFGPASPVLASRHSVLMRTSFVTICNRLRSFAIVCDGLQPFAIVCDHLRSFATVCDHLRSFATVCDRLRPFAIICDSLLPFATICDRSRPFAIVCDGLRPFAIVCDPLRSFATVCDGL